MGVDNGNQISHESFKGKQRKAFHGMALAILQAKQKPGRIVFESNLRQSAICFSCYQHSLKLLLLTADENFATHKSQKSKCGPGGHDSLYQSSNRPQLRT